MKNHYIAIKLFKKITIFGEFGICTQIHIFKKAEQRLLSTIGPLHALFIRVLC